MLVRPSLDIKGRFLKAYNMSCPIGNLLSVDGNERQTIVCWIHEPRDGKKHGR